MAEGDEWRAEFSEKTLTDLCFIRDAGLVIGRPKLASLAAVIREKEEAAEAIVRDRQDELNKRSVTATEKSTAAASRSMVATILAAISTALAAIATAGLVYIGWLQWDTLQKSNDALRGSNRAYVYFDRIELRPYPDPPDNVTVYGITFVVTNSGNTPALGVRFRSVCPQSSADFAKDPFGLVDWSKVGVKPPMILGPKQTIPLQGCNLYPNEIADLKSGKSKIFVVVEARYEDTFDPDNPRITQTFRQLQFDTDGRHSFGFVGPHNCADEDCPK